MAKLPALSKLQSTVNTLVDITDKIPEYDEATLNRAEAKVRNEFQVIEALLFRIGQEMYQSVQIRRIELRKQHIADVRKITEGSVNGATRSSGDTGVGVGTDESSRAERESDKQTRKSVGRSGRKK